MTIMFDDGLARYITQFQNKQDDISAPQPKQPDRVTPAVFMAALESGQRDFSNQALQGLELFNNARVIEGVNFSGADLSKADLRGLTFKDCDFTGAKLTRASLSNTTLERCTFDKADLAHAGLMFAKANNTTFSGANVEGLEVHKDSVTAFNGKPAIDLSEADNPKKIEMRDTRYSV